MLMIVSSKRSRADTIADMIRRTGVLCYPVTTGEVIGELCPAYRAILVVEPQGMCDAESFVKNVRKYNSKIPIYACYEEKDFKALPCFNRSFSTKTYNTTLVSALAEGCFLSGQKIVGSYKLCAIDASADLSEVKFFDTPIKLTKTEQMILRLLIRTYPTPVKPKYMIKHLYKPTVAPEEACIRAHVCSINKRFYSLAEGNLIRPIGREGYVIYTPELREIYGE
jgi:hypothetical protein